MTVPYYQKGSMRDTNGRWVALLLTMFPLLGDYVAIENPQPIEHYIKKALNIDESYYSLLYSVWALTERYCPVHWGLLD